MTKEEAKTFLYSIAGDLGFTDVENYTCKDGEKMREAIQALEQQPCEDCISRKEALYLIGDYDLSMGQVVRGIHALPPVSPQPKTGHWIVEVWNNREHHSCSVCQRVVDYEPCYHYCPYCGAELIYPQESEGKDG